MNLEGLDLNEKDLRETASWFRRNLSAQLSESVQKHLNEALGNDMRVLIRVEVVAVSLKDPDVPD